MCGDKRCTSVHYRSREPHASHQTHYRAVLSIFSPLTCPNWNAHLLAVPQTSIFHTTNWLQVLQASYGYRPYYFTMCKPQQFATLLPFMEVRSWLTGVRGVSLPFSDYCEPIVTEDTDFLELLAPAIAVARQRRWKFLEIRGGSALLPNVAPYTFYHRHVLPLDSNTSEVFSRFRSNYRAKIRKACQQGLTVAILRSPQAMTAYYRLHCLTRQRHGLLPQPAGFFHYIQQHIIANELGFVGLVSYRDKPIAGGVFFTFGRRALYKFGASDIRYQHVYANYALFWEVIQWLCRHGYEELCWGRTAPGNAGLLQFKDGWGTMRSRLNYYRYHLKTASFIHKNDGAVALRYDVCQKIPLRLLRWAGSTLYRHMG